ncbi:MAG: TetR/AcrR family transcriptional regulator [Lachnospiraceae bacterium]|nr:TetR/AcrR family transcriptional regulator [Lachnospiraceae bacterium]
MKSTENSETRDKIIQVAKKEFIEQGYMKASLRQICKKAGVTTGALYFFFKDKDDLFCTVVQAPLQALYSTMMDHYTIEKEIDEKEILETLSKDIISSEDKKTMDKIIHIMYENRELILLILTGAQGSSLENVIDKFINASENQYKLMCEKMKKLYPDAKVSPHISHWFAHDQINALVYTITHIDSEKEAMEFNNNMVAYLMGGWHSVWKTEVE